LGIVPLEYIFDENSLAVKPMVQPEIQEVEEINVGVEMSPHKIKVSKTLQP
jgi:hypothetical protein